MPHSSGGGSHSGGSHSSHSHSSGSHGHHSDLNNFSSSRPAPRISTSSFTNSKRFVYYKNKRPVYIYASSAQVISEADSYKKNVLIGIKAIIVIFAIYACLFFLTIKPASKLTPSFETMSSVSFIQDDAKIFEDNKELEESLKLFEEKTGIIPVIHTVYNEVWAEYYDSLEDYAYDKYVRLFGNDEKCWLIVYSEPKNPDQNFNDWYWEGMQGDETDAILNESVLNKFNKTLDTSLRQEKCSTEECITQAFDSIQSKLMSWGDSSANEGLVSMRNLVLVVLIATVLFEVKCCVDYKKYGHCENAVPCTQTAENPYNEETCDYCGGIYVRGTCINCPHCGANIPPFR